MHDSTEALRSALKEKLPKGALIFDPDAMIAYTQDQTGWLSAAPPAAVVVVRSTDDVRSTLQVASELRVPVVPRAAGSGLAGGANAIDGCIVLSLARMDRILSIDAENGLAVVQPGVINANLKAAAAKRGLWYPPDPASYEFSTLGGNVATNAGGLCCVKYGVTRDYVLGLEVVLADGTVMRMGRKTIKGVAGYDLTGLFVGSEGTLGVITEITLRLRPPTQPRSTLVAFFPTLESVGHAVRTLFARGVSPALLELMDRKTVCAVEDWKRMSLDREAAALLIAQSDVGDAQSAREIEKIGECCEACQATFVAHTSDVREGEQFLQARRLSYPALERLGQPLLEDVAVPRAAIPDLLGAVEEISARNDTFIATFGHVGDGNMHPTIVLREKDDSERRRALRAFDEIMSATLELGGTITGEHGVGILKKDYLSRELCNGALHIHRVIKTALDPLGIMNPGKVIV
ncbi:MAG: FAD-binding protein [Chloroflexi bacterium]|nr:FAD-binding protein [Chloroflexota bacterium]